MLRGWKGYICLDETTVISTIASTLDELQYKYEIFAEEKTIFQVKKPEVYKIKIKKVSIPFVLSYTSWLQISNTDKEAVKVFMKKFLEELPMEPWVYEKEEKIDLHKHLDGFAKLYLLPILLGDIVLLYFGYINTAAIIGIVIGLTAGFYLVANAIPFMARIQWRKWKNYEV